MGPGSYSQGLSRTPSGNLNQMSSYSDGWTRAEHLGLLSHGAVYVRGGLQHRSGYRTTLSDGPGSEGFGRWSSGATPRPSTSGRSTKLF